MTLGEGGVWKILENRVLLSANCDMGKEETSCPSDQMTMKGNVEVFIETTHVYTIQHSTHFCYMLQRISYTGYRELCMRIFFVPGSKELQANQRVHLLGSG